MRAPFVSWADVIVELEFVGVKVVAVLALALPPLGRVLDAHAHGVALDATIVRLEKVQWKDIFNAGFLA